MGGVGPRWVVQTIGISWNFNCFRVLVGLLSSGSTILTRDLELFMAAERDAPTQHSFTHGRLSTGADVDFVPGTLVSVAEGGVLDSVVGFKARGGYQIDAALMIKRDKAFGRHDVVVNRWFTRRTRACGEWVGRGAIWVTDEGGDLEVGDLPCSA
jgi:hypothetical protein